MTAHSHLQVDQENQVAFLVLQQRFSQQYNEIFLDDLAEKTVVIIPSLSLDAELLQTIKGVVHYEERMLCMLLLLRMPRTRVIYVTSVPIDNSIIDYYLHLLPGITGYHARQRLTLLSCYDASPKPLTKKILERPRLIKRIKEHIKNPPLSHITSFNVTELEKELALQLDTPVFGCDPSLLHYGTKSGSRTIFKELGIPVPEGYENLNSKDDIIKALALLKISNPSLEKAVIKMDEGFSGEGNAIFSYHKYFSTLSQEEMEKEIETALSSQLKIIADHISFEDFIYKFCLMGGIVEAFIPGLIKESPSVQCRINPNGETDIISTHDQLLGCESGQVFLGATFPANCEYHHEISLMGKRVAEGMKMLGILGRFSIDFISVKEDNHWKHYAIEVNLRKGGTTHPFIMLQFLTGGIFSPEDGIYIMPNGQTRCYFATDNVVNEKYKGLTPHDLIDISMCNGILYDSSKQTGVMFHMIGALSQHGKLGMLCIAETTEEAHGLYVKTIGVLDRECLC